MYRKHQVEEILLKHIKPRSLNKSIKHNIFDLVDTFLSDDKLSSQINITDEHREKYLNNFLDYQIHIATTDSGVLTPDSYDEYCMLGGFSALRKCLNELDHNKIIDIITAKRITRKRRSRISYRTKMEDFTGFGWRSEVCCLQR